MPRQNYHYVIRVYKAYRLNDMLMSMRFKPVGAGTYICFSPMKQEIARSRIINVLKTAKLKYELEIVERGTRGRRVRRRSLAVKKNVTPTNR